MEGEGVGTCYGILGEVEGASEDELGVIEIELELTRICYAGGGRWVLIHSEDVDRVWHGPSPERAVLAYLEESLKKSESYLERLPEECESRLELARRASEEGDPWAKHRWEEYRLCLERLERQKEWVRAARSTVEGLRSGRIKLKIPHPSEL